MIRQFLSYSLVGISAMFFYLTLLIFQVELLSIDPVTASVIGYIPAIFGSYYLNYIWVFQSKNQHQTTLFKYLIVILIGFGINTLCIYLTVHKLYWWYLKGQTLAIFLVTASNFTLNYFWTFGVNKKRELE